jgi:indoleamine 2,3-dioxygenase
MTSQDCWQLWPDRGLLISPDPLVQLSAAPLDFAFDRDALLQLEALAAELPQLLASRRFRSLMDALPVYDTTALVTQPPADFRAVEGLHRLYAIFASAYVYGAGSPADHLPASIAVPLVALSKLVERPPILTYCGYGLNNWRRLDPNGPIVVDHLALNTSFLGIPDEAWFILTHVDVEARASVALNALCAAVHAAESGDAATILAALGDVAAGLDAMSAAFRRMPQGCEPDIYYRDIRPFFFGFTDLVYEGVGGGVKLTLRGQSGAQSSVVPALVNGLGIDHNASELTQHLEVMREYMPKPHRELIVSLKGSALRHVVLEADDAELCDAYNGALDALLSFRKLHYQFAAAYIFNKDKNAVGTGGTPFTAFLRQLIEETDRQRV